MASYFTNLSLQKCRGRHANFKSVQFRLNLYLHLIDPPSPNLLLSYIAAAIDKIPKDQILQEVFFFLLVFCFSSYLLVFSFHSLLLLSLFFTFFYQTILLIIFSSFLDSSTFLSYLPSFLFSFNIFPPFSSFFRLFLQ